MKTLPWLVTSVASIVTCVGVFGACSSDTATLPSAPEAGAAGSKGTGGRTGGGGASTAGTAGTAGASNACTAAVGTMCDGKEDCPAGQRCCAGLTFGGMAAGQTAYTAFGCFPSCNMQPDGGGDAGGGILGGGGGLLWGELCNPSDGCEDTTATCGTTTYLPGSLSRCPNAQIASMAMTGTPDATLTHKKGEINCGNAVCGANEQCCIRSPLTLDPYCAPKTATCDCNPPDAGSSGDGGGGKGGAAGHGGAAGKAGAAGAAGKAGAAGTPSDSGTD